MKMALCTSSRATTKATKPSPIRQQRVCHQRARRSRPGSSSAASRPQRMRKVLGKCGGARCSIRDARCPIVARSTRDRAAIGRDRPAVGGTCSPPRCMSKKSPSRDVRASRPTVGGPARPDASPRADVLAFATAASPNPLISPRRSRSIRPRPANTIRRPRWRRWPAPPSSLPIPSSARARSPSRTGATRRAAARRPSARTRSSGRSIGCESTHRRGR